MSDEEIRKIKERHYDFFKSYIDNNNDKSWETLVETLLKPEYYSTWDIYSSAITYMIICRKIDITQYNSLIINKLSELWKSIIIALPNERKSFAQIKEEMKQILLYRDKETDKPAQGTEEPAQGTEPPPEKNNNWLPFMV